MSMIELILLAGAISLPMCLLVFWTVNRLCHYEIGARRKALMVGLIVSVCLVSVVSMVVQTWVWWSFAEIGGTLSFALDLTLMVMLFVVPAVWLALFAASFLQSFYVGKDVQGRKVTKQT